MGCKIFLTSPGETNLALSVSIGMIARGTWPRSERAPMTDSAVKSRLGGSGQPAIKRRIRNSCKVEMSFCRSSSDYKQK